MTNAGKYDKKIEIFENTETKDADGFTNTQSRCVLAAYASVKTTKGYTLIKNGSDFEKAYTNFTIRYPKATVNRKMFIKFNQKIYSIEYLNNVNEDSIELEIQAKEVTH